MNKTSAPVFSFLRMDHFFLFFGLRQIPFVISDWNVLCRSGLSWISEDFLNLPNGVFGFLALMKWLHVHDGPIKSQPDSFPVVVCAKLSDPVVPTGLKAYPGFVVLEQRSSSESCSAASFQRMVSAVCLRFMGCVFSFFLLLLFCMRMSERKLNHVDFWSVIILRVTVVGLCSWFWSEANAFRVRTQQDVQAPDCLCYPAIWPLISLYTLLTGAK